jgi:hypothetical protein
MHFYPSAQCFCGLFCWSTRIIQPVWKKRTRPSKCVCISHKLSIQQYEVLQDFTVITRGRDLSQLTYTCECFSGNQWLRIAWSKGSNRLWFLAWRRKQSRLPKRSDLVFTYLLHDG